MIAPIEQGYQRPPRSAAEAAALAQQRAEADEAQQSTVQRLIGNHPVVAVAAAATLGVVLGWVVKRR